MKDVTVPLSGEIFWIERLVAKIQAFSSFSHKNLIILIFILCFTDITVCIFFAIHLIVAGFRCTVVNVLIRATIPSRALLLAL
jgi:hypothetical protein